MVPPARSLSVSDTSGHDIVGSDARVRTKASDDAPVAAHLLFASFRVSHSSSVALPFRTEHRLGVVVNWPSVGLTDDFARRAGLYAEYRLTGG